MKYNTAIYVRLSRDDGDKYESESISTQIEMISKYIELHDGEFLLYKIYKDDGFSGTNFDRPAINELLKDVEQNNVNCIIVKDLSRFGRDYIQVGHYLERYFPQVGLRFVAINDNIDSAKKQYDLTMPIRNIMNEEYAKDTSKKVVSSFRTKQQAGDFIGSFATYGYKKDPNNKHKLIIDEYASNVVKRIFKMFIDGTTRRQIASILNSEGILSPSAYKTQNSNYVNGRVYNDKYAWSYTTITGVLTKEVYIGNMVQHIQANNGIRTKGKKLKKEDHIIVNNTHEPIIDIQSWEKTKNILKQNTRQVPHNKTLATLAGFVRCNDCNKSMIRGYGYKTSDGTKIYYYACASFKRYGNSICSKHSIRYDHLENIILQSLNNCIKIIEDYSLFVESNKDVKRSNINNIQSDIKKINNELDRLSKLKQGLYEDYKDEVITKEEYIKFKQDYSEKEDNLNKKLIILQKNMNTEDDKKISEWLKLFSKYGVIEKLDRDIMATFINCVYVIDDNNNINIDFRFANDLRFILKDNYAFTIANNNLPMVDVICDTDKH